MEQEPGVAGTYIITLRSVGKRRFTQLERVQRLRRRDLGKPL